MRTKKNLVIAFVLGLALILGLVVGVSAGYQTLLNGNFGLAFDYWSVTGTATAYTSWGSCYPQQGPKMARLNNNAVVTQWVTGIGANDDLVLGIWGVRPDSNATSKPSVTIVWYDANDNALELDSASVTITSTSCGRAYGETFFSPPTGTTKAKVFAKNLTGQYMWFDKIQVFLQ